MNSWLWRLVVSIFLIGCTSEFVFADTVVPSDRVKNHVTVRAQPVGSSAVIGRLHKDDEAEYLGDAPHRYQVRLANGVEGFVSKAWTRRIASVAGNLELHFIDVGQGDSTLIICPNGRHILVDAGSLGEGDADAIRDYLLKQLDRTQRRVDDLVITHADQDHYNLLPELLRGVPVAHIYRVGELEDYRTSFQTWLSQFSASKVSVLDSGDHDAKDQPNQGLECGSANVWVLAAAIKANKSRKNAMSIVLMVRHGDFEAILTGDATHATEKAIMERYTDSWLNVDVLKIGHHGSLATSTSVTWADTLKPKAAVASAAHRNSHGHPRKEVLERLDDHTVAAEPHSIRHATGKRPNYTFVTDENYTESIYSTAVSGNVIITSNGSGYSLTTVHHE